MINPEWATPEYSAWKRLRGRCDSSTHQDYKHYGGRGIGYDCSWNSYNTFLSDMGRRPNNASSIDRIDCNGDYCKENCRWTDWKTQERNRRNNKVLTYEGRSACVSEWAEILGFDRVTFGRKLRENLNDMVLAIAACKSLQPLKHYIISGTSHTLPQVAERWGVRYDALKKYLRVNGYNFEKAQKWYSRKSQFAEVINQQVR